MIDTLDTTVTCPDCPLPVHISVPVTTHDLGVENGRHHVALEADMHALRLALHAHARQHQ